MGRRLRVVPGAEELVRHLGLDDPRTAPAFRRGDVVTDTGSSRVQRFREPAPDGALYYLKVYRYRRLGTMVDYALKRSRARAEFECLLELGRRGLPVPEPVACGSHRVLRGIRSCWLLTRGVEGARNLDELLPALARSLGPERFACLRRRAAADLAELVRRMHAVDFFDHDLYFRNVLARPAGDAGDPSLDFWFIDHPRGRVIPSRRRRARRRAVVHDLASLDLHAGRWLSRTGRLAFYLRYRDVARTGPGDRPLLRDVDRERRRQHEKRAWKAARLARRAPARRALRW